MKKGVIVTGGAHGIGRQICLDFIKEGFVVCFMDINEKGKELEKDNLYFYHGDVKDKEQLKAFVDFALNKMGRIDVLVNNACYGKGGLQITGNGYQTGTQVQRLCKVQGRECCDGAVSIERKKQKSVCMCLLLLEMRIFNADTTRPQMHKTGQSV